MFSAGRGRFSKVAIAVAVAVLATSCSDSDAGDDVTTPEFCSTAASAMNGQESVSVLDFSAEFFEEADEEFAALGESSPSELRTHFVALRDGFATTADVWTDFEFESTAPAFLDALSERVDTDAMATARDTINAHLQRECAEAVLVAAGAPGGIDFDRSDPVGAVATIMEAFAADEDTARCIFDAWGDASQVAPEQLNDVWHLDVCGTSIFALMTGDSRFTGRDS